MPCANLACESGYCNAGVDNGYRCASCFDLYCCAKCRDGHRCRNRSSSSPPPNPNPKHSSMTLFERILEMFGNFVSETSPYERLHPRYTEITTSSNAINKLTSNGKVAMSRLLLERAKSMYAIGYVRGVISDMDKCINGLKVDGGMLKECLTLRSQVASFDIAGSSPTPKTSVSPSSEIIHRTKPVHDYRNLHVDEIVRRLAVTGRTVPPSSIAPMILHEVVSLPIVKTSLSDPLDSVVELLTKIIPDLSMEDLERRVACGDTVAMYHLGMCLKYGANGAPVDVKRSRELLCRVMSSRNSACNRQACAHLLDDMRIQSSPIPRVANERCVTFEQVKTAKDKELRANMWSLVNDLCQRDYLCPITMMMVGLCTFYDRMYGDDHSYSTDMEMFKTKYSDYECYYHATSNPCFCTLCDTRCCECGCMCHCSRCSLCSEECRGYHEKYECSPENICVKAVMIQPNLEHPKPYLEYILNMFGIDLDPIIYEDEVVYTQQYSPEQLHDIIVKADGYVSQRRWLPAEIV